MVIDHVHMRLAQHLLPSIIKDMLGRGVSLCTIKQ